MEPQSQAEGPVASAQNGAATEAAQAAVAAVTKVQSDLAIRLAQLPKHQFKSKLASAQMFCVHCAEAVIPFAQKAVKCEVCKKLSHESCSSIAGPCYGPDRVRPNTGHYHSLLVVTFKVPTACQHCDRLIAGLMGDKCVECGYTVHHECRSALTATCYGPLGGTSLALSLPCRGAKERQAGYRAKHPIVLVPGLCSSGLIIQKSETHPGWVGTRVWLSINKLGLNMFKNVGSMNPSNSDAANGQGDGTVAAAIAAQNNVWIQHLALHNDCDPPGITVRAMEGIDAVDFLEPGALMNAASYVFGPLIESLRYVGYSDANLVAAPYDWRATIYTLEKRDQYFTRLVRLVEDTCTRNNNTPVVLLAHSMGNVVTKYFLHFAEKTKGREWIDRNVHCFYAAGGPFLGAFKASRTTANGDNMGLGTFLNDEEARLMCRAMGSASMLWPRGKLETNPYHFVRKEGMWSVKIADAKVNGEEAKGQFQVSVQVGNSRKVATVGCEAGENGTLSYGETFQFPSADPTHPTTDDVIKVFLTRKPKLRVTTTSLIGVTYQSFGEFACSLGDVTVDKESSVAVKVTKAGEKGGMTTFEATLVVAYEPADPSLPTQELSGKTFSLVQQEAFFNECGAAPVISYTNGTLSEDPNTTPYDVPPPVARMKCVYGINLKTEVAFGWRIDTLVQNPRLYMRYKLDKAIDLPGHTASGGIVYETKATPQVRPDTDEQIEASGDGTVPYQSLRYPLLWNGANGLQVEVAEFPGMEHRDMLAEASFHSDVIHYCCEQHPELVVDEVSRPTLASTMGSMGSAVTGSIRGALKALTSKTTDPSNGLPALPEAMNPAASDAPPTEQRKSIVDTTMAKLPKGLFSTTQVVPEGKETSKDEKKTSKGLMGGLSKKLGL